MGCGESKYQKRLRLTTDAQTRKNAVLSFRQRIKELAAVLPPDHAGLIAFSGEAVDKGFRQARWVFGVELEPWKVRSPDSDVSRLFNKNFRAVADEIAVAFAGGRSPKTVPDETAAFGNHHDAEPRAF